MENKYSNLEKKSEKEPFLKGIKKKATTGLAVGGLATIVGLSSLGLTGCVTTRPGYFARTIHKSEPRESFGYDEAIKLELSNYSGKTVTYFIQSISTGRVVRRSTFHIPSDWQGVEFTIGNLPRGSYHTWAEVGGRNIDSWKFSVR